MPELNAPMVANIPEFMEPEESAELIGDRLPAELAEVLDLTDIDVAVDLLQQIPEGKQLKTLEAMSDAAEVAQLLQYQDDTAGGLMIVDYPVFIQSATTPNALDQLRLLGADAEGINSVLVVDERQHLVGSLSVTRLALSPPNMLVGDIKDPETNSVSSETDQEECARVVQGFNLKLFPVLDGQSRLAGVILAEDLVDVVSEEATEDMFRIASVGGERISGPLTNSPRSRLPWLYINLCIAFLPVVASQGELGALRQ